MKKEEHTVSYKDIFYKIQEHEMNTVFGVGSFKEVFVKIGDIRINEDYTFYDDIYWGREQEYYKVQDSSLEVFIDKVIKSLYKNNLNAGIDRIFKSDEVIVRLNSDYILKISSTEYLYLEINKNEEKEKYDF